MLFQFQAAHPAKPGVQPKRVLIKPDGFLRLYRTEHDKVSEHFFFLEVDRSTEPRDTLALRALGYSDFFRRGGLALRYGYSARITESFRSVRSTCSRTKSAATTWRSGSSKIPRRRSPWYGSPRLRKSPPIPSGRFGCARGITATSPKTQRLTRAARPRGSTGDNRSGRRWLSPN